VASEMGVNLANATRDETIAIQTVARERFLATSFLLNSDWSRYGRLIVDIENAFIQGQNRYPTTITAAYNLLVNWKQDPRNFIQSLGPTNDGVSFATTGDGGSTSGDTHTTQGRRSAPGKGKNPPDISTITCYKCGMKGHYSPECPAGDHGSVSAISALTSATGNPSVSTMITAGIIRGDFDGDNQHFQFLQSNWSVLAQGGQRANIPSNWILLDSQSTIDFFQCGNLLHNIHQSATSMDIHSNSGMTTTNLVGEYPGDGEVWYDPNGIANILSMLRMVGLGYTVTYSSADGNAFTVTSPDGSHYGIFRQSPRGLYYMEHPSGNQTSLITTVAENKANYTERDYQRAVLARKIQKIIGRPNTRQFMKIVDNNLLPNCPVTRRDIVAAEKIFGPDVGSLKGTTVRQSATPVATNYTDIPATIMSHYRDITLAGDIMFVNKIPFFVTISRNIKFGTAEMIQNQQTKTILAAIKQVRSIYLKRGFNINTMLMDGQFEAIWAEVAMLGITINTSANDEHVPDVEHYMRTIKERVRAVFNTLPFPDCQGA
jgi:Zinc knuckle